MRSRRSGFTIIELLIVVAIIAAMMTLFVRVVGAFITQAREGATETTIHKVSAMLNQRGQSLRRLGARKGFWKTQPEAFIAKMVPGMNGNHERALTVKLVERRVFPQRRQEILDADYMTGSQMYPTITAAPSANSAEILYVFLTQESVLGEMPAEVDAFSPNELKDTDQNGLLEFVDGWGNPLRFYRWPTKFIPTPEARLKIPRLPTMSTGRDQDDPLAMLETIPNFETLGIPANKYLSNPISGPVFHTPSVYHIPLVVSAGPDGILGLYEPDDTANNGHLGAIKDADALMDDIFSAGMTTGGK